MSGAALLMISPQIAG
ncbi:Protein of unknown function [Bacillus cereus]|nr:Protein of unknown function [Bacillus cereus]